MHIIQTYTQREVQQEGRKKGERRESKKEIDGKKKEKKKKEKKGFIQRRRGNWDFPLILGSSFPPPKKL